MESRMQARYGERIARRAGKREKNWPPVLRKAKLDALA
jgi:hypothetical protein